MNDNPFQLCTRFAVVIGLCSFSIAAELRGDPGSDMEMGTHTACTWETIDYSLTNPTWSDNPFDLVATVTFVHAKETRTTEMFYVGDNTWKFRFTGTRTGVWYFFSGYSENWSSSTCHNSMYHPGLPCMSSGCDSVPLAGP